MYSSLNSELLTINSPFISGDYAEILKLYDLQCKRDGNYLEVGELETNNKWVLYISVIKCQLNNLFKEILPFLIYENVRFKIPRNEKTAKDLLDGNCRYSDLGKIVCIYPENNFHALDISKQIIAKTIRFKGPTVPGNFHLGGCLYTSYRLANDHGRLDDTDIAPKVPKHVEWPFSEIAKPSVPRQRKFLSGRYFPVLIIKSDPKGKVFKGINFNSIFKPEWCLIKQGKKNMFTDDFGRDIQDSLIWQKKLHGALQANINLPRIVDCFIENGDMYLITEFIEGKSLNELIDFIFNSPKIGSTPSQLTIVNHLISIAENLSRLHELGYVHRDLNPANFMINSTDNIYFIDLELVYSITKKEPYPAYNRGTSGFMSPEQLRNDIPTCNEDIYGFGALLVYCLTGKPPDYFGLPDIEKAKIKLNDLLKYKSIIELIISCFQSDPNDRPDIQFIISVLQKYQKCLIAKE